jgi:hypothetical protein
MGPNQFQDSAFTPMATPQNPTALFWKRGFAPSERDHLARYTRFMPADRLSEYKDFATSEAWHRRLLTMLETAGLLVVQEEDAHEPSPVQYVYLSQMLEAAGQQPVGERRLCFTVAPICPQEKIEALFTPHKAELVSRSFRFRIPLSFFDSH